MKRKMEDATLKPPPAEPEVLFNEVAEAVQASTVIDSEVRADAKLEPMREWSSSKAAMDHSKLYRCTV